jgi:hypothetical protein
LHGGRHRVSWVERSYFAIIFPNRQKHWKLRVVLTYSKREWNVVVQLLRVNREQGRLIGY